MGLEMTLLVHFPNGNNSQDWTKPKSGARNFIQVSHTSGRNLMYLSHHVLLPKHIRRIGSEGRILSQAFWFTLVMSQLWLNPMWVPSCDIHPMGSVLFLQHLSLASCMLDLCIQEMANCLKLIEHEGQGQISKRWDRVRWSEWMNGLVNHLKEMESYLMTVV